MLRSIKKQQHRKKETISLNRKEIGQLYYIQRECRMWKRELENLESGSYTKIVQIKGTPTGKGGTSDTTAARAIKMYELKEKIKELKEKAEITEKQILSYIESIPDSRDRQIVYMRAVKTYSWQRIANEIGGRNTADGVRKRYNRIIKK